MMDKLFCKNPWNTFEFNNDGKCFFCNPCFSNFTLIGNIFENDIDEIWNGEAARNFRKDVLERKYTHCNYDVCNGLKTDILPYDGVIADYPEYINLGYDYSCGQKCIICRDDYNGMPEAEIKKWEDRLESHILPITSKAKYMFVNCRGEYFDSKHTQKMVAAIINNNPNIKIEFISNGIKCTKENLIKHNLLDRLYKVHISFHSATRETYKKIFRIDKFNEVYENAKFISSLKREGKIREFEIMFVITDANYKDMPKFVQMAIDLDAKAAFSACIGGYTEYTKNREEYAVFYQNHHNYNDFVKMLKNPIFNSNHCFLPDYLRNLKPISFKQSMKNKIKYFMRSKLHMKMQQQKDNINIFEHDTFKD